MNWFLSADLHLSDRARDMRARWRSQRGNAKRRGIPFRMSFSEWVAIWISSGKWEQRGKNKSQYCMARHEDKGAYEIGNISIEKVEINNKDGPSRRDREGHIASLKEYYKHNPITDKHKKKISVALKGRPFSDNHRASLSKNSKGKNSGKPLSAETKRKLSIAHCGMTYLSQQAVIDIFKAPGTYSSIARRYSIGVNAVSNIKNRKTWKTITDRLA